MSIIYETGTGELFTTNFTVDELRCRCKHCNKKVPHKMQREALMKHQDLRTALGRAYRPKSSYRCPLHEEEAKKDKPGEHTRTAMDIPVSGGHERYLVLKHAVLLGATGIGVANGFVHVDFRTTVAMAWKY